MTALTLWKAETVISWDVCSMIFPEGAESFLPVMATAMDMVMAMDMVTATDMAMGTMANMDAMENIHIIEGKRRNRAKRIVKI